MDDLDDDVTVPFPLEFMVRATPRSLQSSSKAKEAWKSMVGEVVRDRIAARREFTFLDRRPLSVTIFYFPPAPMQGDVDNIVKPILDGMWGIVYPDDQVVERVIVQKFEPGVYVEFSSLTDTLQRAIAADRPVVYVMVDDGTGWRRVP
ncbi:RusA family crossover junction endodeoxyribonuclease [Methylobacterium sp. EM32]|uniref:RusA family crossover junction endodeoxyribonuclease n=1 Tax=Methylobacterium sp. EM32 TaxID=3163481 RepID=UPI0033A93E80